MARRGYPKFWTIHVTQKALSKEHRLLLEHEMRRRLRNFNGVLYYDLEEDNHHLTFFADGRELAIVFTVEHEDLPGGLSTRPKDEPGVATIITQMHQKTTYGVDDQYERVIR